MVRTNNGFEISETDLKLRVGRFNGERKKRALDLMIADLGKMERFFRPHAKLRYDCFEDDPELKKPKIPLSSQSGWANKKIGC